MYTLIIVTNEGKRYRFIRDYKRQIDEILDIAMLTIQYFTWTVVQG